MQNKYMQAVSGRNYIGMDPRTKILILLVMNILAFTVKSWYIMLMLAIIPFSLLILTKRYAVAGILGSLYGGSLLGYIFLIDIRFTVLSIIVAMITGIICRMGPSLLMGYYLLSTTTVSEFVAAMEKIHLPKQIIIPFSVMFRFFPTVKEELSSIGDAMKMRGVSLGKSRGNLISLIEYRMVPLFISCVKIGEELSCSALTRGLGAPIQRTNICEIGFKIIDALYIGFIVSTLLLFIITKGV